MEVRDGSRLLRQRVRALGRRYPRPVWAFGVLLTFTAACYSFLTPIHIAPDEPMHADLVLSFRSLEEYGLPGETFLSDQISTSLAEVRFDTRARDLGATEDLPRPERESFSELGSREDTNRPNPATQHPPGHPLLMAGATEAVDTIVPGSWTWDQEIGVMRLISTLAVGLMPFICFEVARALGVTRRRAVFAAAVPLAIPQLVWLSGTVNNDNLLVPLLGLLTVGLLRVVDGDLSARRAGINGVLLGAALFAKPFAIAGLLWLPFAYFLGRGADRVRAARSAFGALVVAFACGGFWYLMNILLHGTPSPTVHQIPEDPAFQPELWRFTREYYAAMRRSFFGQFGWLDVFMSPAFIGAAFWTFVALFVLGLWRRPDRRVAFLALVIASFVAMTFYFAYGAHARSGLFPALQGRYLFGFIPAVAALMAVGATRIERRRFVFIPLTAWFAFATWGHSRAVAAQLDRWYAPPGGSLRDQVASMVDWAPWPAGTQLLIAAAAGLAWCTSLVLCVESDIVGARAPTN